MPASINDPLEFPIGLTQVVRHNHPNRPSVRKPKWKPTPEWLEKKELDRAYPDPIDRMRAEVPHLAF